MDLKVNSYKTRTSHYLTSNKLNILGPFFQLNVNTRFLHLRQSFTPTKVHADFQMMSARKLIKHRKPNYIADVPL